MTPLQTLLNKIEREAAENSAKACAGAHIIEEAYALHAKIAEAGWDACITPHFHDATISFSIHDRSPLFAVALAKAGIDITALPIMFRHEDTVCLTYGVGIQIGLPTAIYDQITLPEAA